MQEARHLTDFLWDSFRDGCRSRELRLSDADLQLLQRLYPQALCEKTTPSGDKCWYAITLPNLKHTTP